MRNTSLNAAVLMLFLPALLTTVGTPAKASIAPEVDLAWMTEKSMDIVAGEIIGRRCELRDDLQGFKEAVITVYTVQVTHTYKGGLSATNLTEFAVLGGEFGGRAFQASDMPQGLEVGATGIFFLRDWNGLRVPAAWEYGCAMHVDEGRTKVRTLGREFEVAELKGEIETLLAAE